MSTFRDDNKDKKTKVDPAVFHDAAERMGKKRARLLLQQPFYGVLLSMVDFIPETSIPTMATDGVKIYYNPEFAMSITDDEVFGVILHEISHCIYLHCTQRRRLNRAHNRWNYACDFCINLEIKDMGYALPPNLLLDQKFRDMCAEQIYDALPEDDQELAKLGLPFDIHINNSDESSWDDMEDKIVTAYELTKNQKGKGDTPAGLKRWIDKLRKSKVQWERIFHRYVGQALSKDDYSFTRVNKRFLGQDLYLPDLRSHTIGNVVIAIDTSGSIGRTCLEQFAAEIHKISYLIDEITAMSCDAKVHETVKVRKFENFLNKLKFKGGGGTAFEPVFEKVNEMRLQPELLIYLTDGYGSANNPRPNYPVLWVVTCEDGMSYLPSWGQRVLMPPPDGGNW